MFLGMQDFDFSQILPKFPNLAKFIRICPQKNLLGVPGIPSSYGTALNTYFLKERANEDSFDNMQRVVYTKCIRIHSSRL